jgi:hypothetical protein
VAERLGQWVLLGHPTDPVIADTAVIQDKIEHYRTIAGTMRDSGDRLHRIASGQELQGHYADELRISSAQVASDLDRVVGRYSAVAAALDAYEPELEHALRESAGALDDAVAADSAAHAAAGMPTATPDAGQQLTSDEQAENDEKTARTRQAADQLTAARARLNRALGDLNDAGARAAGVIRQGFGDGLKDSGWDRFVHGFMKFLKILVKVLTYLAMALAVIALVIPGLGEIILAAGVAIAAVTVVADGILAGTGNGSWVDFGIAIAGLLTFGAGKLLGPAIQKVLRTVGTTIKNSIGKAAQAARGAGRVGRGGDAEDATVEDVLSGHHDDAPPRLPEIGTGHRWTLNEAGDRDVLRDYTGGGYYQLNRFLRGDSERWANALNHADDPSALRAYVDGTVMRSAETLAFKDGMKTFLPGFAGRTFRGVNFLPKELRAGLRVGERFSDPAVLSTSTSRMTAREFAQAGEEEGVLFQITGANGRDISTVSAFPSEQEVVFAPGTQFEITKIVSDHGIRVVDVTEV